MAQRGRPGFSGFRASLGLPTTAGSN